MLLISQIFAVFRYSKIDFFFLDKNFITVYFYHICVFLVLKLFDTTVFYLKKKKSGIAYSLSWEHDIAWSSSLCAGSRASEIKLLEQREV